MPMPGQVSRGVKRGLSTQASPCPLMLTQIAAMLKLAAPQSQVTMPAMAVLLTAAHPAPLPSLESFRCRLATWQAAVPDQSEPGRMARMETLGSLLDTVETHLLSEIAARSGHFFEAAGVIADLRGAMANLHACVQDIRGQVCTRVQVHCCSWRLVLALWKLWERAGAC